MMHKSEPVKDTGVGTQVTAAPAAGSTIYSSGVQQAGTYRAEITVANGGTQESTAAGLSNATVRRGSTVIGTLPVLAQPTKIVLERVTLDGTQSLNVVAGGQAGVAGSLYVVCMTLTRLAS